MAHIAPAPPLLDTSGSGPTLPGIVAIVPVLSAVTCHDPRTKERLMRRRLIVGGGHAEGYPVPRRGDVTVDIDPEAEPDVVADVALLPFPDQSFDEVVGEHLPYSAFSRDGGRGLREMIRTVRVGGRVVIDTGFGMPVEALQPVLDCGRGRLSLDVPKGRGWAWHIRFRRGDTADTRPVDVRGRIPGSHVAIRRMDVAALSAPARDLWNAPAAAALEPSAAPLVSSLVRQMLDIYGCDVDSHTAIASVRGQLRLASRTDDVTLGDIISSDARTRATREQLSDPYRQASEPLAVRLGVPEEQRPLALGSRDADRLAELSRITGRSESTVLAQGMAVAEMLRPATAGAEVSSRTTTGPATEHTITARTLAALTPIPMVPSSLRRVTVAAHVRSDLTAFARSLGTSSAAAAGVAVAAISLIDEETRAHHAVVIGQGRQARSLQRAPAALAREASASGAAIA